MINEDNVINLLSGLKRMFLEVPHLYEQDFKVKIKIVRDNTYIVFSHVNSISKLTTLYCLTLDGENKTIAFDTYCEKFEMEDGDKVRHWYPNVLRNNLFHKTLAYLFATNEVVNVDVVTD